MITKSVCSLCFLVTLVIFSRTSYGSDYADMAIADYIIDTDVALASPATPYDDTGIIPV